MIHPTGSLRQFYPIPIPYNLRYHARYGPTIRVHYQAIFPPTAMNRFTSITLPRWVDAVWLTLLAGYILAGTALVPLHGDEATQIYMARDFYYLLNDRSRLAYQELDSLDGDAATQQDLRLKDGVLHRYLFGAAAFFGNYGVHDLNDQWVWGAGWDWNHANGHVPSNDLLLRARFVSASMLALGVIVLYAIATNIGGRVPAYIATLFYAINPALLLNGRRAMMEGTMTLFSLLVMLAGLWVIQQRQRWAYGLLGLLSGLAVASKHTSVVTVAAIFFACAGLFFYQALRDKSPASHIRQIGVLCAAGILSLGVFYALNPAWWSNPVARAANVTQIRLEFIQGQVDTFGGYDDFGAQASGFFRQTFGTQVMYTETDLDNFRENLADAIAAYEASPFSGLRMPTLLLLTLAITGSGSLVLDSSILAENRWLIGIWVLAMLALTLLLTPLEWQRYYLPAYPAVALLAGLGVRYGVNILQKWRTQQYTVDESLS